jgi:hypothetical protein
MHFQVVNPLILTLKIEVRTKKYANSLAISLRQSTISRQVNRQEAAANRQIRPGGPASHPLFIVILTIISWTPNPGLVPFDGERDRPGRSGRRPADRFEGRQGLTRKLSFSTGDAPERACLRKRPLAIYRSSEFGAAGGTHALPEPTARLCLRRQAAEPG